MGELTAKNDHYPAEISGTWNRKWILKNGRISCQPEPDIH